MVDKGLSIIEEEKGEERERERERGRREDDNASVY